MILNNNKIYFTSGENISKLPYGIYTIVQTMTETYLKKQPDYQYKNMYGISNDYERLLLQHTKKVDKFGALFSGLSGMGKTQTIKNYICKADIPVLIIDTPFYGSTIIDIVNNIDTDIIIFIDEFEKVYTDKDKANSLLGLFDAAQFNNKVISICSFNERNNLSEYFFNRPGRFTFNFKFESLKPDAALSYITNIINIKETDQLFNYLSAIRKLSYDICNTIVELIKLHGIETFIKFSDCLNIEEEGMYYNVTSKKDGKNTTFKITNIKDLSCFKVLDKNNKSKYLYLENADLDIIRKLLECNSTINLTNDLIINGKEKTINNIDQDMQEATYKNDFEELYNEINKGVYNFEITKHYNHGISTRYLVF